METTETVETVETVDTIYPVETTETTEATETKQEYITISNAGPVQFVLNTQTLEMFAQYEGELMPINKIEKEKIEKSIQQTEKIKLQIENSIAKSQKENKYNFGDNVLFFGPTGTGKTHNAITWCNNKGIPFDVVLVSDGFEDIDFLTHVVPTNTGIQYKEKSVVALLRRAKTEKVAIIIDELNRGSKSFLNFTLKMFDSVGGQYVINNFVADEKIVIPVENIIRFSTANIGGGYVGTNDIDEALFDRFTIVEHVPYNLDFEAKIIKNFGDEAQKVQTIIEYLRELFKDNAIKRPVSTRGIKSWTEQFIQTPKSKKDVFASFEKTLMYKIIEVDAYGSPSDSDIGIITGKFIELGLV